MITDAVLGVFLDFAQLLVGLLPDGEPIGLAVGGGIWSGYALLNGFLPLTEIFQAVAILLAMQALVLAYLVARQVRGWLPFV